MLNTNNDPEPDNGYPPNEKLHTDHSNGNQRNSNPKIHKAAYLGFLGLLGLLGFFGR